MSPDIGDVQAEVNARVWSRGDLVLAYAHRELRPPEVMILVRYRDEIRGRVLELGSGAGRLTGYLIDLAREVRGVDISAAMVAYCRAAYPRGFFEVRDLRDLSGYADASHDAVFAVANVLDVLGDLERRRVLAEVARILAPGGLLVMSSHNLAHSGFVRSPQIFDSDPVRMVARLVFAPRRIRNRRRLRPLERRERDYAILNDDAHEYRLLHYYIERDGQERQLSSCGFDLLECLDGGGRALPPSERAPESAHLHYVARRG